MRVYRLIAPKWLEEIGAKKVLEGQFAWDEIVKYNEEGYNVYEVPNHPSTYSVGTALAGNIIDSFDYVFVDCDLKDKNYASKEAFIEALGDLPSPSKIVDSGHGVHAYWKISDLDPMAYLRLSKRFMRRLKTDPTVGTIFQLMRCPGTWNTKNLEAWVKCELIYDSDTVYTAEELDKALPPITVEDEEKCKDHYHKTYNADRTSVKIQDKLPVKFGQLLRENNEVKSIWAGHGDDRSKNDFRIGHIMFANGFTKDEAMSVLVNSAKALSRAPIHRQSYAENIVDKIWTFEQEPQAEANKSLSRSVKDILQRSKDVPKGIPFKCHKFVDNTARGFRLGDVIGLAAGSGVGKTAFALNLFRWFAQENPDYNHLFVSLEQPEHEIAERWATMSGDDNSLHEKVFVLSNYDDTGNFRHLSLDEIREYVLTRQKDTGKKIGCVVIDHIGALKKKGAKDENQDLMSICHSMKAFAVQTNTLLVMQSQSSREKAGIGDLELNKDAAYGTLFFEAYCDYLITMWQPLKRCHSQEACPTVTAYKFCKIRHKNVEKDTILEDVPYYLYFDSNREVLREMTQENIKSFDWFLPQAIKKRNADRKTDIIPYQSVPRSKVIETRTNSNRQRG